MKQFILLGALLGCLTVEEAQARQSSPFSRSKAHQGTFSKRTHSFRPPARMRRAYRKNRPAKVWVKGHYVYEKRKVYVPGHFKKVWVSTSCVHIRIGSFRIESCGSCGYYKKVWVPACYRYKKFKVWVPGHWSYCG